MDSSTYQKWQHRLGTIFKSVMALDPKYSQMRYVGIADGAKEIVRVNRTVDGLQIVEQEYLQIKGRRGYILEGLTKRTDDVYFTDVEYNIEHDKISYPLQETFRAIKPIFNENKIYGFLIPRSAPIDQDLNLDQLVRNVG